MAPGALAQVLGDLPNVHNDNLLVGFDTSDDASVFRVGENLGLVQSIDFFPPMVDDPFLFGQIAAANSLSDIYAMGGRPSHAMNLLCIPSCLGIEVAGQILAGGADKCVEAGCSIAGGHTINDDEPKYGLSVSGFVALDRMLANSGARVGDVLLLTKAIGSGIITTAIKGELIEQDEAAAAAMFDSMRTLNEAPIRLAEGLELHGCTDITGFGLIGHACEMAEGSGVQ
ncbi:MAG: selenide, water dikinase SelD, partial [Collinsella sp.]|nr:selenide, water dikinase SelD [Collinsella sp.]